jgi:hypothetical protein
MVMQGDENFYSITVFFSRESVPTVSSAVAMVQLLLLPRHMLELSMEHIRALFTLCARHHFHVRDDT